MNKSLLSIELYAVLNPFDTASTVNYQDTLRSTPPENKAMKKANMIAVLTSTTFYMMCGCFGYAAFGNRAPGNMLTGFGFYEPFWLIDLANVCIVVHLVGAYQVPTYIDPKTTVNSITCFAKVSLSIDRFLPSPSSAHLSHGLA